MVAAEFAFKPAVSFVRKCVTLVTCNNIINNSLPVPLYLAYPVHKCLSCLVMSCGLL